MERAVVSPAVAAALAERERDADRGRRSGRTGRRFDVIASADVPDEDRSIAGLRDELDNGDPDVGREFRLLRLIRKRGA